MTVTGHDDISLADLIAGSYMLERSGDISAAYQQAGKALERARTSGGSEEIAKALACLAHCQHHFGHFPQACALAEEALSHTTPDSKTRVDALRIMGSCAHEAGDIETAEAFYHQAIDIARQFGYLPELQACLHSLAACVYIPRGQFELALAVDEESLRLALQLNAHEIAWFPLVTMGWVYWVTAQRERALAIIEEMRGFVQPGSMAEGYYFCLRADLAQDGENPHSAPSLYARARAIAEIIGDPGLNAELRVGLSRYFRTDGNVPAAYNWADDAYTIAERAGSRDLQGWALIERARAAWEIGDVDQAESDLYAARKIFSPMQAEYDLARVDFLLAALTYQQGRSTADSLWLKAATRIVSGGYQFMLDKEQKLAFPLLAYHLNSDDEQVSALSSILLDRLASVPAVPLHIYTLGRFDVQQGRRLIPEKALRQRRAGELFRLLLVSSNRTLLRDQVIQSLWPDKSPTSAQALFHRATSSLRRALEPELPDKFPSRYLAVDAGKVTLILPGDSIVDFELFERHVENQAWQEALACYRGDLYPGDLYADWAAVHRERLKQLAVRAALVAAECELESGRPSNALNACRLALELEPWQEEAVLLGMKACIAQNDRAGAIRLYQKLACSLQEELEITPQKAVQDYYRFLIST